MKKNPINLFLIGSMVVALSACKQTTFKGAGEPVRPNKTNQDKDKTTKDGNDKSDPSNPSDPSSFSNKDTKRNSKDGVNGSVQNIKSSSISQTCINCGSIEDIKNENRKNSTASKPSMDDIGVPLGNLIAQGIGAILNSTTGSSSNSKNYSNSSSENSSGIAAIGVVPSSSDPCKVEVSNSPSKIFHKTPSNLASHVYRGTAGYSEYFRSYTVFCQKYASKQVTVDKVIAVALSKGHIDPDRLDCSYRSALESMLKNNCR